VIEQPEYYQDGQKRGGGRYWRFTSNGVEKYKKEPRRKRMAQEQIIDLLSWVKKRKLSAETERWLCPFSRRIKHRLHMLPHQKRTALPVPTVTSLRKGGMEVESENVGNLKIVRSRRFIGAGATEIDAVLSMLNQFRRVSPERL